MGGCCQSCFEDCYWYCIEERFCFDKNIANYNPDEDEYLTKRSKGFNELHFDGLDRPICEQPGEHHEKIISSRIHEEDYRQIQTNVPFLAPEILAVFANSQIFHDNQPTKSLAIVHKSPTIHDDLKKLAMHSSESDSEKKLLKRLEGIDLTSQEQKQEEKIEKEREEGEDVQNTNENENQNQNVPIRPVSIGNEKPNELILRPVLSLPSTSRTSSIDRVDAVSSTDDDHDDDDDDDDEEVEQNKYVEIKARIQNKPLRAIQSFPYFSVRPASETDIFTIAGSSMISMTPEIPSISYTTLPKNYDDTPTIEKYKESVSLYSIQTSNMERLRETDFSMPRYYGKSDIIAQSVENLSTTVKPSMAVRTMTPKKTEKSKRLKLLRANLPPLSIHINKEKSKERNIE